MKKPDYTFKPFMRIRFWKKKWDQGLGAYFRGANFCKLYFLWVEIEFGLPYLKEFIYQQGYDAGFTAGYYRRDKIEEKLGRN